MARALYLASLFALLMGASSSEDLDWHDYPPYLKLSADKNGINKNFTLALLKYVTDRFNEQDDKINSLIHKVRKLEEKVFPYSQPRFEVMDFSEISEGSGSEEVYNGDGSGEDIDNGGVGTPLSTTSEPFIWKYDMDLLGDTNIGNYLGKRYIRCSKHDRKWIEVQIRRSKTGSADLSMDWNMFKKGYAFGYPTYWFGNEHLHAITHKYPCALRICLKLGSSKSYCAYYENFSIGDQSSNYKILSLGTISGNLHEGDVEIPPLLEVGKPFSTYDRDNRGNCNRKLTRDRGGWWYTSCDAIHPNSLMSKLTDGRGIVFSGENQNGVITDTQILITRSDGKPICL